ncbi:arginine--tRNA ligase [Candidatus Nomurabacteria bacterium RIFCSPHIGHO2_01_FULL_40_20]|uniref:Arginine--tRNA ligase n=2 Tax=Candidatus Nomuraibacteriota TaxID=1752729 RepID=A0A1F6V1W4_9BACT|nr:MAG: arginine--tRNA ligase [Candidatus Nomurabacteria bacterium RIFCSPHIGHO2_01_FULL_40_20]
METIEDKLKKLVADSLKVHITDITEQDIKLEHPKNLEFGDYSCVNLHQLIANFKKNHPDIHLEDYTKIFQTGLHFMQSNKFSEVQKVEEKSSFINFYLTPSFFFDSVKDIIQFPAFGHNELYQSQKVMVEYTQPNPFKPFHIGHLMSNAIGESISRIMEYSGAEVVRANYQGDVGPHVAKAIWALMQNEKETKEMMEDSVHFSSVAHYIGKCYAEGAEAYENNPEAKHMIDSINKKIYENTDDKINKIYDWGFKVTMQAFDEIYAMLGTKFDHYFMESEMAPIGLEIVKRNPQIFELSDGAVVFHAEKYDPKLHTRVFINSKDLPTYETKEIGLTVTKFEKENPNLSIVTTAVEQAEYMKVVCQAIELMYPDLAGKMKHITHGMMRFAEGKMSSRKGNVVTGESLLADARSAILGKIKDRLFSDEELEFVARAVGVSAIKYSILKQAIGGDIVYDFEKSISFEGDSGPYLQYSYARAQSVLKRGEEFGIKHGFDVLPENAGELEKMLYRFPEAVLRASQEFEPHYIVNYLIEISRMYNAFYANEKIATPEDPLSPYRLALTQAFTIVLKKGLHLLGIIAPEKM